MAEDTLAALINAVVNVPITTIVGQFHVMYALHLVTRVPPRRGEKATRVRKTRVCIASRCMLLRIPCGYFRALRSSSSTLGSSVVW